MVNGQVGLEHGHWSTVIFENIHENIHLRSVCNKVSNSKKFSDFSASVVIQSNLFRVSPVPSVTSNGRTEIQD